MKKGFLLSLLLGVAFVGEVHAAGWDYAVQSGNNRSQYQRPIAKRIQARQPQAKAIYRNGGQQQVRYQGASARKQGQNRYNQNDKKFYITPRLGFSYVNFLDSGDMDVSGFGLVGNIAAGMYLNKNFRIDGEIGYHFEREVAEEEIDYLEDGSISLDYSQMDFMLNGYYDIQTNSPWTPFVGAGVGLFNTELSIEDYSSSETVFGVSVAGGASYAITDKVSAEGMLRGKYLFDEGAAVNLDALVGLRFSF